MVDMYAMPTPHPGPSSLLPQSAPSDIDDDLLRIDEGDEEEKQSVQKKRVELEREEQHKEKSEKKRLAPLVSATHTHTAYTSPPHIASHQQLEAL